MGLLLGWIYFSLYVYYTNFTFFFNGKIEGFLLTNMFYCSFLFHVFCMCVYLFLRCVRKAFFAGSLLPNKAFAVWFFFSGLLIFVLFSSFAWFDAIKRLKCYLECFYLLIVVWVPDGKEIEWVFVCREKEIFLLLRRFCVGNYALKNQYFFHNNFLLCFKYCFLQTICAMERIHFYGTRIKI